MRTVGLILAFAALAACEPSSARRPEPSAEPKQSGSGISISGYGRVGVSTSN
ncbi:MULTISPECIES: hypothetical protein [unclassified Ruegeria]|uniref:hypothetical protein n=1 Tax=unclassified Ruegeria TaxID=2625375 RepID=UPI001488940F|nr:MULTISPECIES: hypothetical protein [unclassified Ruegeria]NOG07675.1 hypothetical protein [Ruegeria sp. HKCCD4315]